MKTEEDPVAISLAACGTVQYTLGVAGGAPKHGLSMQYLTEVGGHHFEKLV